MRRHVRTLASVCAVALLAAVLLTAGMRARMDPNDPSQWVVSSLSGGEPNVPPGGPPAAPAAQMLGGGGDAKGTRDGALSPVPVGPAKDGPGAAHAGPAVSRKVVMTATLTLEVKEFAKTSDQAIAAARQLGGYVSNSQLTLPTEDPQQGSVTIRVPQERYQEALDRLKSLGRVLGEGQSAEDVTERYVDLDARVRNLRLEEERILDILRRSRTMKETLLVEERLSAVRERLETIEGQLRYLKYQVAMATITVTLLEKASVVHFAEPQWVWWNDVKGAWHALVLLLQSLATVLTYVGVFGVVWVPLLGIVRWSVKRRRKGNDIPPDSL